MYKEPLLEKFIGREERLKNIYRFSIAEFFRYRSNLWYHELRVSFLTVELCKIATKLGFKLDFEYARLLSIVHDDAEMVTGDVQLGHKQHMSREQLADLDKQEELAIEKLSEEFPERVGHYVYKELLLDALHKRTLEAKVMKYADRLDAYGESLHEVLSGNLTALRPVLTYTLLLATYSETFPELMTLFEYKESPLTNYSSKRWPDRISLTHYEKMGAPYSKVSLSEKTDLLFYDEWKQLQLDNLGEEGVRLLVEESSKAYM